MRKVLAVCVTASVLALAACGSSPSSSSSLDSVKVKPGADASSAPEVTIDAPFLTDKEEAAKVINGDGAEVNDGDTIKIQSGLYKTIDGLLTNENFTGEATEMTVDNNLKSQMPELYNTLVDSRVGDWIVYATVDGVQQADGSYAEPAEGARAERLIVVKITDSATPSAALEDTDVQKLKDEKKLPTVAITDGTPKITIPKDVDAPAGLVVDVLEEGTGAVATETSTVGVKYLGVQWSDGAEFDGNFDSKEDLEFALTGVIKGWTQGLTGLKAGSKVMLSIPADLAYGNSASSGQPAGPLVFYVELNSVTEAK